MVRSSHDSRMSFSLLRQFREVKISPRVFSCVEILIWTSMEYIMYVSQAGSYCTDTHTHTRLAFHSASCTIWLIRRGLLLVEL